jgi:hypothetical protein
MVYEYGDSLELESNGILQELKGMWREIKMLSCQSEQLYWSF